LGATFLYFRAVFPYNPRHRTARGYLDYPLFA
jgi:hypothetical protein